MALLGRHPRWSGLQRLLILEDAGKERFRELLPLSTKLVALFFQLTLVSRALARLEGAGEDSSLRAAVAATESAQLEVSWK